MKGEITVSEWLQNSDAEEILVNWVNYQLKSISYRTCDLMQNFSIDLKDGQIYVHLLSHLAPGNCNFAQLTVILHFFVFIQN